VEAGHFTPASDTTPYSPKCLQRISVWLTCIGWCVRKVSPKGLLRAYSTDRVCMARAGQYQRNLLSEVRE
jgi:hypothetical protein